MKSQTAQMSDVLEIARGRVADEFPGTPHFVEFCKSLISYVITGKGQPAGTPSGLAKGAVNAAATFALVAVFGANFRAEVDRAVLVRLAAL